MQLPVEDTFSISWHGKPVFVVGKVAARKEMIIMSLVYIHERLSEHVCSKTEVDQPFNSSSHKALAYKFLCQIFLSRCYLLKLCTSEFQFRLTVLKLINNIERWVSCVHVSLGKYPIMQCWK